MGTCLEQAQAIRGVVSTRAVVWRRTGRPDCEHARGGEGSVVKQRCFRLGRPAAEEAAAFGAQGDLLVEKDDSRRVFQPWIDTLLNKTLNNCVSKSWRHSGADCELERKTRPC